MLVCGEEGEDVVALRVQDGHRHLVVVLLHHRRRVERRQRVLQANTKRIIGLKTVTVTFILFSKSSFNQEQCNTKLGEMKLNREMSCMLYDRRLKNA